MNDELLAELLRDSADGIHVPPASAAAARRRARQRDRRLRVGLGAGSVGVLIGGVALVAGGDDRVKPGITPGATNDSVTGLTVVVSITPSSVPGQTYTVPAGIEVTHLDRDLQRGDSGDDVKALQEQLVQLGFDTHGVDGQFGSETQMAVWAFEGAVLGRPYTEQTGVVTDEMWLRMLGWGGPPPVPFARRAIPGTHVEIYLPTQVMIVFTDGQIRLITHISSGSGEQWCEVISINTDDQGNAINPPQLKDICGVSKTPGGVFEVGRIYEGLRMGALGGMENPVFFNYGIAIHGADNVPGWPVSHGNVRIPMWVAVYFPTLVSEGDRVYVWGMDGKQPEEYTREESLPVFTYPNPNPTVTTSA